MGVAGSMALAGALGGLGQSIVSQAEKAREDALMLLQRKWQVEDRDFAAAERRKSDRRRGVGKPKAFEMTAGQSKAVRDMLESEGYEGIELEKKFSEFQNAARANYAETGNVSAAIDQTIAAARPGSTTVTTEPGRIGKLFGAEATTTEIEEGIEFSRPAQNTANTSDEDAVIAEARDAISNGAPRSKVEERLKSMGIDPSKL